MKRIKNPFETPDIYGAYQPAPSSIKKKLLAQLLPLSFLRSMLFMQFLLFTTPMLLLYFEPSLISENDLLIPLLATLTTMYLLFSILSGYLISTKKFPGLQEIKNLLGYTE